MIASSLSTASPSSPQPVPRPHTWSCDTPGGMVGIFEPGVQLAFCRRQPDARIAAYLEAAISAMHAGRSLIVQAGGAVQLDLPDRPGRDALVRDIEWITGLYTDLLGCPAAAMRIEVLNKPMCPRFHVDRTGIRLTCTWRGPGTEFLDDAWANRERLGAGSGGRPDEESGLLRAGAAVARVPTFAIALLKGSLWQGNDGRGLIHRSPTIPAADAPRVMMSLDAVWER